MILVVHWLNRGQITDQQKVTSAKIKSDEKALKHMKKGADKTALTALIGQEKSGSKGDAAAGKCPIYTIRPPILPLHWRRVASVLTPQCS